MFRPVFSSIIRSPRLYIQHQVYVIEVRWLLASGHEMKLQFHLVPASKLSTNLYDIYLMLYVKFWTPDDGRKDCPKHVEWYSINPKNCVSSWFYYRNDMSALSDSDLCPPLFQYLRTFILQPPGGRWNNRNSWMGMYLIIFIRLPFSNYLNKDNINNNYM